MKVLILHQHFNTPAAGGALRSYYLATALVAHGITPIVITAHNKRTYEVIRTEGIEIHYLPIAYNNSYGFWKRGRAFIAFAWGAFRLAGSITSITICYAMSVPLTVGIAAMGLKYRNKIPYIFEVGDLWPEAPVQLGFIKSTFLKNFLYFVEKAIYRNARFIVALSTPIQQSIEQKVPGKEVHLIPNMADTDFYKPEQKDPVYEKKFNVLGKFVVSYIGAVGLANGLEFFVECARASRQSNLPIHFLLCGDGARLQDLKRLVTAWQLDNFSFVSFRNRDGIREVMNVTDASFICYQPVPILETGSPNKYFDGLAAGKFILVNFKGWIKEEIEKNKCGLSIDSREPGDFARKLESVIHNKRQIHEAQHNSRQLAISTYSRQLQSAKFVELFHR